MNFLGKTKFMSHFDDVMGVFHTHTVAGLIGGMATGVFATTTGTIAYAAIEPGAVAGVWKQLCGSRLFFFFVGKEMLMLDLGGE